MIVKNEEQFLRQCLESVKDLVDEMIIVDTGSKDKTVQIAKEFKAKVFNFKWNGDFSAARNFSLKKATKDWILVLDADETISSNDVRMIRYLANAKEIDGFFFTARNYANFQQSYNWERYNDRYEESKNYETWYPAEIVRLFRNKKGFKFKNKMNEVIDIPKGRLAITHIPIHHFAWEKFSNRIASRRALLKKKALDMLKGDPKDLRAGYELARIYIEENNLQSAEDALKRTIDAYEQSKEDKKKSFKGWLLYESLAQVYMFMKRYGDAIDALSGYVKNDMNNPSSNALLAHCMVAVGRHEESKEHFKRALHFWKQNPNMLISIDTFFNSYGIALLKTNKTKEACHAFAEAIKANPLNANAYNNMGAALLKIRDFKNASVVFKKAVELGHENKAEIASVISKIESKLNKN